MKQRYSIKFLNIRNIKVKLLASKTSCFQSLECFWYLNIKPRKHKWLYYDRKGQKSISHIVMTPIVFEPANWKEPRWREEKFSSTYKVADVEIPTCLSNNAKQVITQFSNIGFIHFLFFQEPTIPWINEVQKVMSHIFGTKTLIVVLTESNYCIHCFEMSFLCTLAFPSYWNEWGFTLQFSLNLNLKKRSNVRKICALQFSLAF